MLTNALTVKKRMVRTFQMQFPASRCFNAAFQNPHDIALCWVFRVNLDPNTSADMTGFQPVLFMDFLIHFTKCLLDFPMTRKDMLETKQLTNSRFSRSTNEPHQMSARDRLVLPHLVPVARCSEGQSVRPRRGETTRLSEELLQQ